LIESLNKSKDADSDKTLIKIQKLEVEIDKLEKNLRKILEQTEGYHSE